jgi:hypothetical protein
MIDPRPHASDDASLNRDGWKQQYTEVNNNLRLHSTLRFAIFTLLVAALGGVTSISFGFVKSVENPDHIALGGRLAGFFITTLIFYYELRIQSLINHDLSYGQELEALLGYNYFSKRPAWGKLRSHNVTRLFFVGVIVFWLFMAAIKLR